MKLEIAVVACGGPGLKIPGPDQVTMFDNQRNQFSPCQAYQKILEASDAEVLVYCHDDVTVHDSGWLGRIRGIFDSRSECVAVGLGGAVGLGTPDLYRKRFNIWNLARQGYGSNQDDAEVHGTRFTEDRRVAVLEQFCMAVRTDWLRKLGGWPVRDLRHHMLDGWIACQATRDGKEIWQAGVRCHHAGGASSTKEIYAKASWLAGGTLAGDHEVPHRWLAEEFRDVLPIRI